MPRVTYVEAFDARVPPPRLDDASYHDQRQKLYPGIHGGFPRPQQLGGYSAENGHAAYKTAQDQATAARNAYRGTERQSYGYVQQLPDDERAYYSQVTEGYVPSDHAALRTLARNHADTEYV